jgi:hypothetical protein
MKQLLILTIVQLTILLSTTSAIAQNNSMAHRNKQPLAMPAAAIMDPGAGATLEPMAITERISKKFAKEFAYARDARWTKDSKGLMVYFTQDGVQNRAFLTKHGNFQAGIRYYAEKNLPADVRHRIKGMYYDFAITSVTEVRDNRNTVYLVSIADDTSWKVICYIDGKIEAWETYKKG